MERRTTPTEKSYQVAQMMEPIRQLHLAEIRQRNPDADEQECFLRF